MTVANQLFQLQDIDTELEFHERSVQKITRQLADSSAITEAGAKLAAGRQKLLELTKQQRSIEWELDDLSSKIKVIEEKLYSGRIRNPKELTDLQHEADLFKTKKTQIENKDLETMEQVEAATTAVNEVASQLKKLEEEAKAQNVRLAAELEDLKAGLARLKQKREFLVAQVDPHAVVVYQDVIKKRGTAVAKVEQGLCRGCRIRLSVSELQRAKTGALVQCGSCGRILFFS